MKIQHDSSMFSKGEWAWHDHLLACLKLESEDVSDRLWDRFDEALIELPRSALLRALKIQSLIHANRHLTTAQQEHILQLASEITRLKPEWEAGWRLLGDSLDVYKSRYDEAEQHLRKAISIDPTEDAIVCLSRVLAQQGKRQEALSVLATPLPATSALVSRMRNEIIAGEWDP